MSTAGKRVSCQPITLVLVNRFDIMYDGHG